MDQFQPNLGGFPSESARRDAIHIAVAPIVAGEPLAPGEHVGVEDRKATRWTETMIGVVDPFLKECVSEGQTFWLFLYPGTVTSIRHVWSHPAFVKGRT